MMPRQRKMFKTPMLSVVFLISVISCSVSGQTYSVSTLAGSGLPPHDTLGVSAALGPVRGVAVDAAGNVFMSLSLYNSVVRLDAKTGSLTQVAGNGTYGYSGDNGPAANAQLFDPRGLAVDAAGNLYVADTGNLRIRKVSNGVISTLAGNGMPGFSGDNGPAESAQLGMTYLDDEDSESLIGPGSVAVDSRGNVYLADTVNHRIRKVAGGVITTVAGIGTAGFGGDGGEATNAQLDLPWGVAADSSGKLYIGDTARIRQVINGVISTVAGDGTQGFSGDDGPAMNAQLRFPNGIAVDSAGNVYIADTANNRIRTISNGAIATVAGNGISGFSGDNGPSISAELSSPIAVALDPAGNLYIADSLRVRKVGNGIITTVAGDGELRVGGDNGPAESAQLYDPYGIAVDSAGNVYIADTLNNRIRKVSNGVITTVAGNGRAGFAGDNGSAMSAQLFTPIAVAVDSAGILYIADINNLRIRQVSNGVITTVPGTAGFEPYGVAVDSAANVYIAAGNQIIKVANGVASTLATAQEGLFTSVAVDAAGNVYFADTGSTGDTYLPDSGIIRKVSNGVISTLAGGNAVAADSAGNVYIGDETLNLVRKISDGVLTSLPVSPALRFRSWQIAVDSAGRIYCEDASRTGILVLTATGTAVPSSVSVDSVTNAASNLQIPIAPGEIVTLSGAGLGPTQFISAHPRSDGYYDTQLAGTSVRFNGIPAPILYTSATQIAAVVPYAVTAASAQLTVTYLGQTSASPTVAVASSAPALFTADSMGKGQAAALNENGALNSASTPARMGSVLTLFATGEGQTSPQGVDGKPATAPFPTPNHPVSVTIDTQTIFSDQILYAGGGPGEVAGVLQINVRIPAGITPGIAVPVFIHVGNATSQVGVSIAVSGN